MTARTSLNLALFTILTAAGCGQILGISDYEIDPKLGPDTGEGGGPGEGGSSSGGKTGGKSGSTSQGGGDDQGGEPGQGGEPAQAGGPGQGGTGAGGEGGQPPAVVVIPCDSIECCENAGGIVDEREMLDNVGFEQGQAWWGEDSSSGYDLIVNETDTDTVNAHAGAWFTWFGGATDEIAVMLTPTLDIPADTGWVTLSGWRFSVFDSTTLTTDYSQIQLYEEGIYDQPYEDIFLFDNYTDHDTSNWTAFEAGGPGEFYAGLPLQLSIIGVTDALADDEVAQAASNFFYDDISFTSSRCLAP